MAFRGAAEDSSHAAPTSLSKLESEISHVGRLLEADAGDGDAHSGFQGNDEIVVAALALFSTLQPLCFILLDRGSYPMAMANSVWRTDLYQLQFHSLLSTRVREGSSNSSTRKHSEGEAADDSRSTAALSVTEGSASPVATHREDSWTPSSSASG